MVYVIEFPRGCALNYELERGMDWLVIIALWSRMFGGLELSCVGIRDLKLIAVSRCLLYSRRATEIETPLQIEARSGEFRTTTGRRFPVIEGSLCCFDRSPPH